MNWALWTRRFIFFTVVAIAVWDVVAAAFGTPVSTISLQLYNMGLSKPTIVFGVGYLMGHVFGRIDA